MNDALERLIYKLEVFEFKLNQYIRDTSELQSTEMLAWYQQMISATSVLLGEARKVRVYLKAANIDEVEEVKTKEWVEKSNSVVDNARITINKFLESKSINWRV